MRRLAMSFALAAVLALGACAGGGGSEPTQAGPGEDLPAVAGGFGEQPTLEFPEGGAPEGLQVETLHEGDGEEVTAGAYIVADYIGQVWGAETPFNDSFASGSPIGFSLDRVIEGWSEGIPGARVGDRIILSIPSEQGYGPNGNPNAGIGGEDTIVFVIDVLQSLPADAWYAQPDARDTGEIASLPVTIEGALGSEPTITVIEGSPEPTELTVTVVAEGSGEPVGTTGSIIVAYHASTWTGEDGGSTWSLGSPESVPLGYGTVFDTFEGVTVGSRVVVQLPGEGDVESAAFVVDVLGFVQADPATDSAM